MGIKTYMLGKNFILNAISVEGGVLMSYMNSKKEVVTAILFHTYASNGKIIEKEL